MAELFTQEQARAWLRANNLKTGKSIQDAFINEIKGVLQEALEEEMNSTLGYSKYDYTNKNTDNSRNGHTKKTVKSQFGKIELDIPRDADGEHEPIIVKKHERTISSDLEGMIVSLFSQGMSNRDIGSHMSRVKERTFDLPLLINPNGRISRIRLSSGVSHSRKRFITSINPPDLVSSSY